MKLLKQLPALAFNIGTGVVDHALYPMGNRGNRSRSNRRHYHLEVAVEVVNAVVVAAEEEVANAADVVAAEEVVVVHIKCDSTYWMSTCKLKRTFETTARNVWAHTALYGN